MNIHQFKQWLQNNLWHGEQGEKPENMTTELIASLVMPNVFKVWGVDVSHWNTPPVDLKRMRDVYDMSFVIIKANDGSLVTRYASSHIQAAKDAGLPFGLYVWLYPDNRVSIDAQVSAWAKSYNDYKPALGMFIDAEWTTYAGQPANPTAVDLRLAHDKLKAKIGRTSTTYTAAGYADTYLKGFDWSREPLWVANYGVETPQLPKGASGYTFWQFTSQLDGVALDPNGNKSLDGNYYNGTKAEFENEYSGGVTPPIGGNVKYELKPAGSYNVSIRAPHPDSHIQGTAIGSIPNGSVAQADDKYVYPADKYVNGVLRAKAQDTWYHVTNPADGWSAEIHLGVRYCNVTEIAPLIVEDVTVTVQRDGWRDLVLTGKQEKL